MKLGLILTSTVVPEMRGKLVLVDPEERLLQYRIALGAWSALSGIDKIVMCDNSGHDPFLLARNSSGCDHVRVVSFRSSGIELKRGKGAGEMEIIRRALNDAELASCDLIIKCTGRLWLRNARSFIHLIERDAGTRAADCFVDMRSRFSYADSRVFVGSERFYREFLLPQAGAIDDSAGNYFEHALARATLCAAASGMRWSPLPPCRIAGQSGSTGVMYGGTRKYAKDVVRYMLQRRL